MTLAVGDIPIWDLDLASFVDQVAGGEIAPGAGSASMVSAAMGMALVLKALRVTAVGSQDPELFEPLLRSGENLREELAAHAEADLEVLKAMIAARQLPTKTEVEQSTRETRLDQAREAAIEVPLNAAQSSLEGLNLARQAIHLCDLAAASEVGAGATLLNGALTAALYNVDSTLRSIKDAALCKDYRTSRDHLKKVADERLETIRRVLASRLSPDAAQS